jgi:hypothetical protein
VKHLVTAAALCLFCLPVQADTFSITRSNGSTLTGYTHNGGGFAYDNHGRSVTWTYQPSYRPVSTPVYQPRYAPLYRPNLSFMGGYRLPVHNW